MKIGQKVWFMETWTERIVSGTIRKLINNTTNGITTPYAEIKCEVGVLAKPIADIYPTKDEAIAAKTEQQNAALQAYLNEINSTEDLVRFLFTHNACPAEEYTDWTARQAVVIKAKELLSIDL